MTIIFGVHSHHLHITRLWSVGLRTFASRGVSDGCKGSDASSYCVTILVLAIETEISSWVDLINYKQKFLLVGKFSILVKADNTPYLLNNFAPTEAF